MFIFGSFLTMGQRKYIVQDHERTKLHIPHTTAKWTSSRSFQEFIDSDPGKRCKRKRRQQHCNCIRTCLCMLAELDGRQWSRTMREEDGVKVIANDCTFAVMQCNPHRRHHRVETQMH